MVQNEHRTHAPTQTLLMRPAHLSSSAPAPVVQWCSGAVVQWCSGAVVQWCGSAVVQWCSSAVCQCLNMFCCVNWQESRQNVARGMLLGSRMQELQTSVEPNNIRECEILFKPEHHTADATQCC
jgi:hypothetical protein